MRQEVLGLKHSLKEANDQCTLLFNEVQKAWRVSSTLQADLKVAFDLSAVFTSDFIKLLPQNSFFYWIDNWCRWLEGDVKREMFSEERVAKEELSFFFWLILNLPFFLWTCFLLLNLLFFLWTYPFYWALAEQHNCSQMQRACIGFMASPNMLGPIMETDGLNYPVASLFGFEGDFGQGVMRLKW